MRCTGCGGPLRPDDAWCGLCYAPAPAAPVPAAVAVAEPAPPAPVYHAVAARVALSGGSDVREWTPPPPGLAERLTGLADELAPEKPPGRFAGLLAIGAILVNGAFLLAFRWLVHRHTMESSDALRNAALVTLTLYAVVGAGVFWTIRKERHPLRLRGPRPVAAGIAMGVLAGPLLILAIALVELLLSGQAGLVDPRVALLASEGDLWHIAAVVLIGVVAAPVVEELLFRGLLLPQLSGDGRRYAIWASAFAFAVWHLNFHLVMVAYYTLIGAYLGRRYVKSGLTSSIATHATFNGLITLASIAYVLAPGAVTTAGPLRISAPRGWHLASPDGSYGAHLTGPSASEVLVLELPRAHPERLQDDLAEIASGRVGTSINLAEIRRVHLPVGDAVRAHLDVAGHDGEYVMVATRAGVYGIVFGSGGSDRARADFDVMLQRLQVV